MAKVETEIQPSVKLPQEFVFYINQKLEKNGEGGRPHFLQQLAKQDRGPIDEVLTILERAWIKLESIGKISKDYNTSYYTIWRLIQELEPYKQCLTDYLTLVPRKKVWFNPELETSDYETVKFYIKRAKRDEVKTWKENIKVAMKCWKFLKYRDPAKWTDQDVIDFLNTLPQGSQSRYLDAIRQVAPQIREGEMEITTGRFREKLGKRKKDLFHNEINMITEALRSKNMTYHETILKCHISWGAREGSKGTVSGMVGITWDRFKEGFTKVDIYESKAKGGIFWRNCPCDLLWKDLPERIKALWIERGKPINAKLLPEGYKELLKIYKEIRQAISEYWNGKTEPSLFKELTTIKPHDADKIHCNLLWEAGVPLEVLAGTYLGKSEGIGLVGRGWLELKIIKDHYLSLTQRSIRFQRLIGRINKYSTVLA